MSLQEMDAETLSLVLRLQLDDLEELKDKKGKGREGEVSDAQLAIDAYQNELAVQEQLITDLAMSRRIARGAELDAHPVDSMAPEQVPAIHNDLEGHEVTQGDGASERPPKEVSAAAAADMDDTQASNTGSCDNDIPKMPSHDALLAALADWGSNDSGNHGVLDDKLDPADPTRYTPQKSSQDTSVASGTTGGDDCSEVSANADESSNCAIGVAEPASGESPVPLAAAVGDGDKSEIHMRGSADMDDDVYCNHETLSYGSSPKGAESSAQAASFLSPAGPGNSEENKSTIKCDSCHEKLDPAELAHSDCPHRYCRKCLEDLFRGCLTDEGLFPPRCCQRDIPLDREFLSEQLIEQYRAKELEFECPDRTYCHQSSCSAFIPRQSIHSDIATCPKCSEQTCALCKGATHAEDCPLDVELLEVLRVAEENRWKRCSSCRRVVERTFGCNHITCLCKAQFCYVCGQKWGTCTCPFWDEERLLDRTNVVVNRAAAMRPNAGGDGTAAVERVRRNLVRNAGCRHRDWTFRRGSHQCEECLDVLPVFIFECDGCGLFACGRCRRHGL
ncbi:hypothetical protein CONLIGDRAFT_102739 [Coniochaeta ligniaria NRRL 30616]|uniref:RBR-type E3 ubiquitin transferase n=1 Tax=Coniochaeta ligniaria NRRL 30616 TaxID=1408157 RepID=A0A1J7J6A1_9PEZI|nr:hypothetical protein CONLIGDRAFT_102739 [Coniochaeta ligniaria NRRL 30616]